MADPPTGADPPTIADPQAIVPYLDDDFSFAEDIQVLDENFNLNLYDYLPLTLTTQPDFSFDNSISQSGNGMAEAEADDPPSNQFVSYPITSTTSNSQVGTTEVCGEGSHRRGILQPDSSGFGNPVQLWPGQPAPYSCRCEVLREITHTRGIANCVLIDFNLMYYGMGLAQGRHVAKLEIHGKIGVMNHAILENRFVSSDLNTLSEYYQMIDFSKKSIEDVKKYLVQYCEGCKDDGYTLQQNPLFTFYEALCVGLFNGDDSFNTDDFFQPSSPDHSGENQVNQQPGPVNQQPEPMNQQPEPVNQTEPTRDEVTIAKTPLAAQRERTGKLTLKDLARYFHLPIEHASRVANVCPTVIKKVCRKFGLGRWPYRKIKSIENKISRRRESLNGKDAEERARTLTDVDNLQKELARIFDLASDG